MRNLWIAAASLVIVACGKAPIQSSLGGGEVSQSYSFTYEQYDFNRGVWTDARSARQLYADLSACLNSRLDSITRLIDNRDHISTVFYAGSPSYSAKLHTFVETERALIGKRPERRNGPIHVNRIGEQHLVVGENNPLWIALKLNPCEQGR